MAVDKKTKINPRQLNRGLRKKYRARFKAMELPCHICGRRIDYSLPYYITDENGRRHVNMQAMVIDEVIPISRCKQFGYSSQRQCAEDWSNILPAHAYCNAMKGKKLMCELPKIMPKPEQHDIKSTLDGKW